MIWATRRFLLTGDQAFAFYVAVFAVGMFTVQTVRIDYAHHILGLRVNEWAAIIGFAAAVGYLYRTRHARSRIPVPALAAAPAADPGADPGAGSRAQLRTWRPADPEIGPGDRTGTGPSRSSIRPS